MTAVRHTFIDINRGGRFATTVPGSPGNTEARG